MRRESFMKFDSDGINSNAVNNALTLDRISMDKKEKIQYEARAKRVQLKRDEKIIAGADANVAQHELLKKEMELVEKQNELLQNNYKKLEELFNEQVETNRDDRKELKRSKHFNLAMMIISTIAMIATIAGPIATIWVSK